MIKVIKNIVKVLLVEDLINFCEELKNGMCSLFLLLLKYNGKVRVFSI